MVIRDQQSMTDFSEERAAPTFRVAIGRLEQRWCCLWTRFEVRLIEQGLNFPTHLDSSQNLIFRRIYLRLKSCHFEKISTFSDQIQNLLVQIDFRRRYIRQKMCYWPKSKCVWELRSTSVKCTKKLGRGFHHYCSNRRYMPKHFKIYFSSHIFQTSLRIFGKGRIIHKLRGETPENSDFQRNGPNPKKAVMTLYFA